MRIALWREPMHRRVGGGLARHARSRRVPLNRRQVQFETDGSSKIVLAHRDPGVPNRIDTAGLRTGMIFWRFLLPDEEVPPIEAEVVDVGAPR